jgi:hypothetical protein
MRLICRKVAVLLLGCVPLVVLGWAAAAFLTVPTPEPSSPWFAVARRSALEHNGQPQRVPVLAPQRDAWARLPEVLLGHVFVRLSSNGQVIALRAETRNNRLRVVYDETSQLFRSPCWAATFDLDGREIAEGGHPLFDETLEQLPVQVSDDVVWIRYESPGQR